jgi:alkylated DNA nucleotide flippase Atl1
MSRTGTSPTRLGPDADMSVIDDVREAVIAIPPGSVASYGDIGKRIGASARQVGRVMSLLDDGVPWWRVVYADGTPASCHRGQAPALLSDEGTPMLGARVDMKRVRQRRVP